MDHSLKGIQKPIAAHLLEFEAYFKTALGNQVPLLSIITNYLLRRKGKQIRPSLVFLSAQLNGEINNSTYVAASMIELLHTATLVHDDVVDESYERRGMFSINALWKTKIAVLLGDYLLSRGLLIAMKNDECELLSIMSSAVEQMIEGELYQIQKTRKLDITEEEYFSVITKKTALLFSASTACGTKSVTNDANIIAKMKIMGEYIGIAFQIKDDIFDFEQKDIIGKPWGNDIKEKKLTLPVIYALKQAPANQRATILKIINKPGTKQPLKEIKEFIDQYNGIEYASGKMYEYKDKAIETLQTFPENDAREALIKLIEYIVARKN